MAKSTTSNKKKKSKDTRTKQSKKVPLVVQTPKNNKKATIKINDHGCPPPVSRTASELAILQPDQDEDEIKVDYVAAVDVMSDVDITNLRGFLLGTTKRPARKNLLPRAPVKLLPDLNVLDLYGAEHGLQYLTIFPNKNVVTDGLSHLYTIAQSFRSQSIFMTQPVGIDTDVSMVAAPFRTAVSHGSIKNLNNSFNQNVVIDSEKYATDEIVDVNSLFRMIGAKFSPNIAVMSTHLYATYIWWEQNNKSADWIKGQTLNMLDKFYYKRTNVTETETRTSLLDVRCICIPIVGNNHFSLACVMNLPSLSGAGGKKDPVKCIIHLDSLPQDDSMPDHVTWDVGIRIRSIINSLYGDNEREKWYTPQSLPIHRIPCARQRDGYSCGYRMMIAFNQMYYKVNVLNEFPTNEDQVDGFYTYSEVFRGITASDVLLYTQDFSQLLSKLRNYEYTVDTTATYMQVQVTRIEEQKKLFAKNLSKVSSSLTTRSRLSSDKDQKKIEKKVSFEEDQDKDAFPEADGASDKDEDDHDNEESKVASKRNKRANKKKTLKLGPCRRKQRTKKLVGKTKRVKRRVDEPASTPVHLKDEKARPKALSIMKSVKKMHTLTTYASPHLNEHHPSSKHYLMIDDSVVKLPYRAKDKVYTRLGGPVVGFLVPPGETAAT